MSDDLKVEMPVNGWDDLRPEVRDFALALERRLRDNDYKPGWKSEPSTFLLVRLQKAIYHLWHRLHYGASAGIITNQAADVANFAMMIADVSGGISTVKPGDW